MKLKYKGPILSLSGGLIGLFSYELNDVFKANVGLFFHYVGFFLILTGIYMIFTYHDSDEYKKNKEKKDKQPWE